MPKKGKGKMKTSGSRVSKGVTPAVRSTTVQRVADRPCTITHREFLGSVSQTADGSTGIKSFLVEPGNMTTFPWGYKIYRQFEWYESTLCRFEYVPGCNMTMSGRLTMAFDYDASDSAPAHREDIASWTPSVSFSPWQNCDLSMDVGALSAVKRRYTMQGNDTTRRWSALGQAHIMWDSSAGSAVLGELYITTTFILHTPQMEDEPILTIHRGGYSYGEGNETADDSSRALIIPRLVSTLYPVIMNSGPFNVSLPTSLSSDLLDWLTVTFPGPGKYLAQMRSHTHLPLVEDTSIYFGDNIKLAVNDIGGCLRGYVDNPTSHDVMAHWNDMTAQMQLPIFAWKVVDIGWRAATTALTLAFRWAASGIGGVRNGYYYHPLVGDRSFPQEFTIRKVPDDFIYTESYMDGTGCSVSTCSGAVSTSDRTKPVISVVRPKCRGNEPKGSASKDTSDELALALNGGVVHGRSLASLGVD